MKMAKITKLLFILLLCRTLTSCDSGVKDDVPIESKIEHKIPYSLEEIEQLKENQPQLYKISKEKEYAPGFTGARVGPFGLIAAPFIIATYLSLDEWYVVEYEDKDNNQLKLRYSDDRGVIIDGEIRLKSGIKQHIAHLEAKELNRRFLIETGKTAAGKITRTSIQSQIDLLSAYRELLSKKQEDYERGRVIREGALVLGIESIPFLKELIENGESDDAFLHLARDLCRNEHIEHSKISKFEKEVIQLMISTNLGPKSAVEGLKCYSDKDELSQAKPLFNWLVHSVCSGDVNSIYELDYWSYKKERTHPVAIPVSTEKIDTICKQSKPYAAYIKLKINRYLKKKDIKLILTVDDIAERAIKAFDLNKRDHWDALVEIGLVNPELVYDNLERLLNSSFSPSIHQLKALQNTYFFVLDKKILGFISGGYTQEKAKLIALILKADKEKRRSVFSNSPRLKEAISSSEKDKLTDLQILSLVGGNPDNNAIIRLLGLIDPESLEGFSIQGPELEDIDDQSSLIYYVLSALDCTHTQIVDAKKTDPRILKCLMSN